MSRLHWVVPVWCLKLLWCCRCCLSVVWVCWACSWCSNSAIQKVKEHPRLVGKIRKTTKEERSRSPVQKKESYKEQTTDEQVNQDHRKWPRDVERTFQNFQILTTAPAAGQGQKQRHPSGGQPNEVRSNTTQREMVGNTAPNRKKKSSTKQRMEEGQQHHAKDGEEGKLHRTKRCGGESSTTQKAKESGKHRKKDRESNTTQRVDSNSATRTEPTGSSITTRRKATITPSKSKHVRAQNTT